MKLPKDTLTLSMDSPTFAEDFATAIGLQPGEAVEIMTPQFGRTDGLQVPNPVDFTRDDWENLHTRSYEVLKALGCQIWDIDANRCHWLFPCEWYDLIPDGLTVVDINNNTEVFCRETADDDRRFGALSFGFIELKENGK